MLFDFEEKKKTFFGFKKPESKKSHFFKRSTHAFGQKNANFFFT